MSNYFRVTGYCPEHDFTFIVDCYGYYEQLWEVSSDFVKKGMQIIAVGDDNKFLDGNFNRIEYNGKYMVLQKHCKGKHEIVTYEIDGVNYEAIKVDDYIYVPNRNKIVQ